MTRYGANNRLGAYVVLAYPCVIIHLQFGVWSPAYGGLDNLIVLNRGLDHQKSAIPNEEGVLTNGIETWRESRGCAKVVILQGWISMC